MINLRESLVSRQAVRLDWRAYWKEFSRSHGGFPVKYRGVLLFRDGWTYSSSDYAGPEWPPPHDPRESAKLQRAYWLLRKREVRAEWWWGRTELDGLKNLQSTRSLPLQHASQWAVTDEAGIRQTQVFRGDVDFQMLEIEVKRLREELDECERNLHDLQLPGRDSSSEARDQELALEVAAAVKNVRNFTSEGE